MRRIFHFISYILISCLVVLMFGGSYYSLSESFPNNGDFGDGVGYHNFPENTVDVVAVGSSHAQYSFNPAFFYQDTGLYSYVLASACQPLSVSFKMLREAFKTQHPKVAIVEVFTSLPMKNMCSEDSCYIISSFMMTGQERYSTIKELPQEKQDIYLNPFTAFHNDWKNDEIKFEDIYNRTIYQINKTLNGNKPDINKVTSNFGYVWNNPTFPVENYWYSNNKYKDVNLDLFPEDEEALNDINQLCKDNDVSLILYKTPIDSLDDDNLTYLHRVWEWAERNNIPYIDFVDRSEELEFHMQIHSDSFHSYLNGASIITNELASFINDNYVFEHVYNDELENIYYNSALSYAISYLDYEYDPKKYLSRLANYDGPILIEYKKSRTNSTLNNFLSHYNITDSSICLFDKGELIDSSETCIGINYKGHDIYADFTQIEIDGENTRDISNLTIVAFSSDLSYHKIVETDTNKMWKKGFEWYGE